MEDKIGLSSASLAVSAGPVPAERIAIMKFGHILFPIDFSEHTQFIRPAVERMANHFGSRVTLLHVFEIPAAWYGNADAPLINTECLGIFSESAKRRLEEYRIELPESRVQRVIAEGEAGWHIADWAKDNGVDLIMMGTHGYGRVRGLLLGSVTAKVIHDADCPVWTDSLLHAPAESPKPGFSNILCAVDADEEAVAVLQFADGMAKEFQAEVQLVHAVPGAESRPAQYFDFDFHRYLMDSARVELSKRQRAAGTDFPLHIRGEAISKAIAEIALQKNCDLILIGRGKARAGLGRLRTHAYQIIRDAPCPVISYSTHRHGDISSSYSAAHPVQSGYGPAGGDTGLHE